MITFRTAYLPTQDADAEKLQMAPMDYNEEVEYNPSEALTPQGDDGNVEEAYGLEQAQDNTGANVATGVAVGAAAAAGTAAVVGSSMQNDDRVEDENPQASVSQDTSDFHQSIQQDHPRSFDDDDWLDDTSSPVGAQY